MSEPFRVTFYDDAAGDIRKLSEELGMNEKEVIRHLISDGLRDHSYMDVVKDTLEHLKKVYSKNSDVSHEEFMRLMGEAKQIPIDCVENSIKRNEIVQKAFAFSDESSAYMQRMTVIDEITAELKAKGVFA